MSIKADPSRGVLCHWPPKPGVDLAGRCDECGHAVLAHVGTDHCPVCELVWQATPMFRRQQQLRNGVNPRHLY